MDKLDIVITLMVTGFGLVLSLLLIVWNSLNTKIEGFDARLSVKIEGVDARLSAKIDKLDEKLTDRRLCRLEGAFSSKDCCMIKMMGKLGKRNKVFGLSPRACKCSHNSFI